MNDDRARAAPVRVLSVPAGEATLYVREVGEGRPVILVHGGPDFDRRYLLPELDRLVRSRVAAGALALVEETWSRPEYDLLPALRGLPIPALVIHGEHDLVPVGIARRIADALPRARFELIAKCGHFAYLERPERIATMITTFLDQG